MNTSTPDRPVKGNLSSRRAWIVSVACLGTAAPLAVLMFQTCSSVKSDRAPIVWALIVDQASTVAADELAATIDSVTYDEDAADLRLLKLVKTLDVADDVLPREVARLQAARRENAESERMRAELLATLDAISRDYEAVLEASQERQLHQAVLEELVQVPETMAHLRAAVASPASE